MDHSRPKLALGIGSIKKSFLDATDRGVKLKYITEIMSENIPYCKELMRISEVRHLDGIKGNFMVSEKEYLAPAVSHDNNNDTHSDTHIASQLIYSNVREIVEQQNYIFDTLWNKAIPAIKRFREIEEGIGHTGTRLLEDPDEIYDHMRYVIGNASKRKICSSTGGMQLIHSNFFDLYKKILDKYRSGEGEGIRWILTVDKDNKELVKIFLVAGVQIRHLKNLTPMKFAVDDNYFHATIDKMENGKMMQSLLASNDPIYINHYNSIFEELWKNGTDAAQRIKDIEEGADIADIEVFQNVSRAKGVYLELVKEATKEILFIFPTANAFSRQHKIGAVELAENAAIERDVKVRILMPPVASELTEETLNMSIDHHDKVQTRHIEQMLGTKATILVVDRKESLVMELRDDSKTTFDEAVGLSTYSNSKAGVLSYVAIFESLWSQTELYQEIKKAHEVLKLHDKAQKMFVNVAAHELRTPIQPILGLSQILLSKTGNIEQYVDLIETINRNAKRLNRLSDDILDVTKIESNTLELRKEQLDLNEVISNAMDDIMSSKKIDSKKVQLIYQPQDIIMNADKGRLIQVISNLLSNAIEFTKEGTIAISTRIDRDNNSYNSRDNQITVSIQDTGSGIDPDILPELFSKFATKSFSGTGLGLFISKGIIEAHSGMIWAANNKNGKGATFSFKIPMGL
jgi:signal transduction histidine kinase